MKKASLFFLLVLLIGSPLQAQVSKDVAAAGLRATRLITSYSGEEGTADSVLVEAVGAVGDVARSQSEVSVAATVRRFAAAKMANLKTQRAILSVAFIQYLHTHEIDSSRWDSTKESLAEIAGNSDVFESFRRREDACRADLDAMLRSGLVHPSRACDAAAPKMFDVEAAAATLVKGI